MVVLSDRLLQVVLYVFTICITSDNMKDASGKAIHIVKYHSAMICHRQSISTYMESVKAGEGRRHKCIASANNKIMRNVFVVHSFSSSARILPSHTLLSAMSNPPPPPPRRTYYPSASSLAPDPSAKTWKDKVKAKGSIWGKYAMDKSVKVSDNLGGKVNDLAERRFGTEAFWPVTGDFPKEMDKCARILRAFTGKQAHQRFLLSMEWSLIFEEVDGIITEEKEDKGASGSQKKKVIRKIPPAVIAKAKGLAIFTSMRSGIAPFGGAGGAGVVVAKLPDGSEHILNYIYS